jgi:hypothetical protein
MAQSFEQIEQKLIQIAETASLVDFVADAVNEPRIHEAAQQSLIRLSLGDDRARMVATVLAAGVRSEMLAGITTDTAASHSLPDDTSAALTSPFGSDPAPMVFREELTERVEELDNALATPVDGAWNDIELGQESVPVASIAGMVWCGLCAVALADGIPFDEIQPCLICLTCAVDV